MTALWWLLCEQKQTQVLLPGLQSSVQLGVVCAQDKNDVEPALGEQVTAVIVHDHASFTHLFIQLIHNLQNTNKLQHWHSMHSLNLPAPLAKRLFCLQAAKFC